MQKLLIFLAAALLFAHSQTIAQTPTVPSLDEWEIHDLDRPQPVVVTPGELTSTATTLRRNCAV